MSRAPSVADRAGSIGKRSTLALELTYPAFDVREVGRMREVILERFPLRMLQAVPDPHGEPVQQLACRSAQAWARLDLGTGVPGRGLDRGILEIVLLRARVNVAVAFIHGDAVLAIHGSEFPVVMVRCTYPDMGTNLMLVK
jgi:hypothetical protein